MSARPLVSPAQAEEMRFPDLARNVRENIEQVKVAPAYVPDLELLTKLVDVLERKIGEKPPELPPAPVAPAAPVEIRLSTKKVSQAKIAAEQKITAAIKRAEGDLLSVDPELRDRTRKRLKQFRGALEDLHLKIKFAGLSPRLRRRWKETEVLRRNYDERLRIYKRDLDLYNRNAVPIRCAIVKWHAKYGAPKDYATRLRIVEHLRADVHAYARREFKVPVSKVWWRFLPPGPDGILRFAAELGSLRKRYPHLAFDELRLEHAHSLKPSHVFVGQDEFDGYFAFVFAETDHVLFENPQEGNAAYIFKRDWASLSRLPKFELMGGYPHCIERVLHRDTGNWKRRIKCALQLP